MLYAQGVNQKMVLSAHAKSADAAGDLYRVEKLFEENMEAKKLKETHRLIFNMELLEPYVLVIIKPIASGEVKNKLRYVLQSAFPKNFVVDDAPIQMKPEIKKETTIAVSPIVRNTVKAEEKTDAVVLPEKNSTTTVGILSITKKIQAFWKDLESEWLGLIFLALAGFLLVYRSTKQMNKIKQLQEKVTQYQSKVEGEIEYMGDKDA